MKKCITVLATLFFIITIAVAPAYSGGGKVQGEKGKGTVDQGETGSMKGNARGADAQGNQA